MNILIFGKSSIKYQYLRKKIITDYHLIMEDITDVDYPRTKNVCKDFEIKNLREYHDLYAQSNIFLLADVFENFQNICVKICELGAAKFISVAGLTWQAALKKDALDL